jgi:hypothetical protein
MGTEGPFPGGKARPGRDADHSPPSNAEVKNEQELYLLFPHAPPWRVARSLYLLYESVNTIKLFEQYVQRRVQRKVKVNAVNCENSRRKCKTGEFYEYEMGEEYSTH